MSSPTVNESAAAAARTMHPAVATAVAVEKALARLPAYGSAHVSTDAQGVSTITASLSTRSDVSKSTKNWEQSYSVDASGDLLHTSPLAAVSDQIASSALSPSGKWRVNLRAVDKSEQTGEKRIVEVVSSEAGLLAEIDVTNTHSTFLGGDTWGSPVWRPDEQFLAYTAEQHPPHWDSKEKPYDAYEYYPIAGEQLTKASKPAIFLVDFRKIAEIKVEQVTKTGKATDTVFCQPVFGPGKTEESVSLYATGHDLLKSGRRLGIIFCTNRPASLYSISYDLQEKKPSFECFSEQDRSTRCPAVVGDDVFHFSCRRGFEHNSCHQLHRTQAGITSGTSGKVLVHTVWDAEAKDDEFPGLYPPTLPRSATLSLRSDDNKPAKYLTFSSQWRSQVRVVAVDCATGQVSSHTPQGMDSMSLLATDGQSRLVAIRSNPLSPPTLVLGQASLTDGQLTIKWRDIKTWVPTLPADVKVDHLRASILRLKGQEYVETIVSSPMDLKAQQMSKDVVKSDLASETGEAKQAAPLIIYLHGGPNGTSSTTFAAARFAYLCAGFSVAETNYPGSTGFGQKHIEELSKDCGNIDVKSIVAAFEQLVAAGIASKETGKSMYLGGSHSGFIGGHLSARWPKMFDAVVLANPVIDMPSCFATSDIPDWSTAQFNVPYDFSDPPSFAPREHFEYLRRQSPSSYLEELFAQHNKPCMPPTLLQIGEVDLRVPKTQGIAWYHALKGHGENVRMLYWPDNNHSLSKPWTKPKVFESDVAFFVEHAKF